MNTAFSLHGTSTPCRDTTKKNRTVSSLTNLMEPTLTPLAGCPKDGVHLSVPYITHLMAVASLVGEYGGDEDLVIAGLLHDAVEDQGGKKTLSEIRAQFGDRVAWGSRGMFGCRRDPQTTVESTQGSLYRTPWRR
jgi:hypothetical protein